MANMEDIERQADQISKGSYQAKQEDGKVISVPGYVLETDAIVKCTPKFDKDGSPTGETDYKKISNTAVYINKIFENLDDNSIRYELIFIDKGKKKKIDIPGDELFIGKNAIRKLTGIGARITERNNDQLKDYFDEYLDNVKVTTFLGFSSTGWKNIKDVKSYVIPGRIFQEKGHGKAQIHEPSDFINAIETKGTYKQWVKIVDALLKYNKARFKCYVAVVPLIMDIIGSQNFLLNDYGDSSSGKTTSTFVAMSMYGRTHISGSNKDIMSLSEATQVGVELTAAQACDVPLFIDDVQKFDQDILRDIVTMLGNGQGKKRGKSDGNGNVSIQKGKTWRNITFLTSEASVITSKSFGGVQARLIEIHGGLEKVDNKTKLIVERTMRGIKNNYGSMLPELIKYIIQNQENIEQLHVESEKEINALKIVHGSDMQGIVGRSKNHFATILTAGKIFEKVYEGAQVKPINVISPFLTEFMEDNKDSFQVKGLQYIQDWVTTRNSGFFDVVNGKVVTLDGVEDLLSPKTWVLGAKSAHYVDIIPEELNKEIKKNFGDGSLRSMLKQWKDSKVLVVKNNKNKILTREFSNIKGMSKRMYVYRFDRVLLESPN